MKNENTDALTMQDLQPHHPRVEPSAVYDLEVLISRLEAGETMGRAANLPLASRSGASVRETLQTIIEEARVLIRDSLARGCSIPWTNPPTTAEENESRFIVPLVLQ